MQKMNSLN